MDAFDDDFFAAPPATATAPPAAAGSDGDAAAMGAPPQGDDGFGGFDMDFGFGSVADVGGMPPATALGGGGGTSSQAEAGAPADDAAMWSLDFPDDAAAPPVPQATAAAPPRPSATPTRAASSSQALPPATAAPPKPHVTFASNLPRHVEPTPHNSAAASSASASASAASASAAAAAAASAAASTATASTATAVPLREKPGTHANLDTRSPPNHHLNAATGTRSSCGSTPYARGSGGATQSAAPTRPPTAPSHGLPNGGGGGGGGAKPIPGGSAADVKAALRGMSVALDKTQGAADPAALADMVRFDETLAGIEEQYAACADDATDAAAAAVAAIVEASASLGPSELGDALGHPKAAFFHLVPHLLAELRLIR